MRPSSWSTTWHRTQHPPEIPAVIVGDGIGAANRPRAATPADISELVDLRAVSGEAREWLATLAYRRHIENRIRAGNTAVPWLEA